LKQRRGAITIMTALTFFALVMCAAIAIDFSRLWTVRNELQTAADAGAIAGAMQLVGTRDSLRFADSANAYVHRNRTLTDSIQVDSVEKGHWDPTARTFTTGVGPTDAVNVVTSYNASRLWMRAFGATVPRMKARSIAWSGAPVATTNACMKPWAIPYEELMYRLNIYRGINPPNSIANMTRPFDQVNDLAALQTMTAAQRTFTMKLGTSDANGVYNPGTTGNYQAVKLGKYWDYATQNYASPPPLNGGANTYVDHINGTTCYGLAVGDSLQSEQGNMVGPTLTGLCDFNGQPSALQGCTSPSVCTQIVGTTGVNFGNCIDSNGQVGVDVKAAFFSCNTGCNGSSIYSVNLLGSFTLTKVYPSGAGGPNPAYSKSQIVGEFKPIQAMGGAGGGSTTLVKLLLVK
jgi:hypothetical protein